MLHSWGVHSLLDYFPLDYWPYRVFTALRVLDLSTLCPNKLWVEKVFSELDYSEQKKNVTSNDVLVVLWPGRMLRQWTMDIWTGGHLVGLVGYLDCSRIDYKQNLFKVTEEI